MGTIVGVHGQATALDGNVRQVGSCDGTKEHGIQAGDRLQPSVEGSSVGIPWGSYGRVYICIKVYGSSQAAIQACLAVVDLISKPFEFARSVQIVESLSIRSHIVALHATADGAEAVLVLMVWLGSRVLVAEGEGARGSCTIATCVTHCIDLCAGGKGSGELVCADGLVPFDSVLRSIEQIGGLAAEQLVGSHRLDA